MAPRKKAAKKAPAKSVAPTLPENEPHPWPEEVLEKHRQRREEAQKNIAFRVEQKRQRLINNGVPPEKRSV
jgi:hypothetical protein